LPVSSPPVYPPAEAVFHFTRRRPAALHAHFNSLLPRSLPIPALCTDARDHCCMYRGPPCIASIPEHSEPIAIVLAIAPSRSTTPSEHLRCPHSRVAAGLRYFCHSSLVRSALQPAVLLAVPRRSLHQSSMLDAMPLMHVERERTEGRISPQPFQAPLPRR
jgi:hypothetical protein